MTTWSVHSQRGMRLLTLTTYGTRMPSELGEPDGLGAFMDHSCSAALARRCCTDCEWRRCQDYGNFLQTLNGISSVIQMMSVVE